MEDAREFAEIIRENDRLKDELRKRRYKFYIGANAGTYGVGASVGMIF